MPFYEWECSACGARTEVLRTVSEFEKPPEGDEIPPTASSSAVHTCTFTRVLGATPTTFKHNDRTAHKP